jgi:hypothetical protein
MLVRALLATGAAVASYRLLAHERRSAGRAARLVAGLSRGVVLLLFADALLLPIPLAPTADVETRLLVFTLTVLIADAALRWNAVCLAALAFAAVCLLADGVVRALAAFNVPGIAVNEPEALQGLNGRSPGASFEWTGQAGYPKEYRTRGRWNSWGFNDREPPSALGTPGRPSESADPIVLMLGDSYVEALQVSEDAAFFRVAEEQLRAAGHAVRMVGLGESGSGACGAADRLETYGDRLRPAVVVYAFVYNDVRNDYAPWTRDAAEIEAKLPGFLSARFATFVPSLDLLCFHVRQRARAWLATHRSRERANPDALMFADSSVGDVSLAWQATLGCVDRMAGWSRTRGSAFAVLELPPGSPRYTDQVCGDLSARGNACDPELPRRRLVEDAQRDGHAFLTPAADFQRAWQAGQELQFRFDGHYNAAGHRIVGQFLGEALRPLLMAAPLRRVGKGPP